MVSHVAVAEKSWEKYEHVQCGDSSTEDVVAVSRTSSVSVLVFAKKLVSFGKLSVFECFFFFKLLSFLSATWVHTFHVCLLFSIKSLLAS